MKSKIKKKWQQYQPQTYIHCTVQNFQSFVGLLSKLHLLKPSTVTDDSIIICNVLMSN